MPPQNEGIHPRTWAGGALGGFLPAFQRKKQIIIDSIFSFATVLPLVFGFLMKTFLPKIDVDQRQWHVVDAEGVVLGQLATKVADVLRGKNKPTFTPHLDAGDFVVVINAEKVKLTGKKEDQKTYMSYSGYFGGERYRSVPELRQSHPDRLILHAVKGMLPKNRLGRKLLTKLKVYRGTEHPHSAQQPQELSVGA